MPEWAVAVIATSIGTVIGFVLSVVHGNKKEKNKLRNESLRNHFIRFQESTIKPIMNTLEAISNEAGILTSESGLVHYTESRPDKNSFDYGIFRIHFPTQANQIENIYDDYERHNRKVEDFKGELAKCIREKTKLELLGDGSPPFVHMHTTEALYYTLYQIVEAKLSQDSRRVITHDFSDAVAEKLVKRNLWRLKHRYPLTGISIYAVLVNEQEAKSCQQSLISLQNSSDLQEQMVELYSEAIDLEKKTKNIAKGLDFICEQYGNLNNYVKKEKECPYCQTIV
jgi:hypothetical protein